MNCDLIFAGVGLALVGCIGIFNAARRWKKDAGLGSRMPTTACGAVRPGLVQVSGRAVGDATITSEILGASCLISRVKIEAAFAVANDKHQWREVFHAYQGVPFFVEDESGRVRVDPLNAELDLTGILQFSSDDMSGLRPEMLSRLQSAGLTPETLLVRLQEIYAKDYEKSLDPKNIPIFGSLVQAGLRRSEQLGVSPVFNEGIIREKMHEEAQKLTQHRAMRCKEENLEPGSQVSVLGVAFEPADPAKTPFPVVIQRGHPNNPLLIGTGTRTEVLGRVRKNVIGRIALGLLLAVAGAGMIVYCYIKG